MRAVSSESAETMGAMASKNASDAASSFRAIAAASASEVSEPVALVRRGHLHGAHLVQRYADPPLGERPRGFAPGEPAPHYDRTAPQLATDSAGTGSSTVISCPHFRHLRETPLVLVCFSSIPTNPQLGQATTTGRFHVE